jgi:hypothetical protein
MFSAWFQRFILISLAIHVINVRAGAGDDFTEAAEDFVTGDFGEALDEALDGVEALIGTVIGKALVTDDGIIAQFNMGLQK